MVQAEMTVDRQSGDSEGGERWVHLMRTHEQLLPTVTPHLNVKGER